MRVVNRSEKKTSIIQAAITSFAQNGYEKTSISDIASKAGIATGGIYNYFKNKEELFERCCTYVYDCFSEGLSLAIQQGNRVYSAVLYTLQFFHSNIEYARILLLESRNFVIRFPEAGVLTQWYECFVDLIQKVLADEFLSPDRKDRDSLYVSLLIGGIESILIRWLFRPGGFNMTEEEIALQMTQIVRHGSSRDAISE